MSNGIPIKLLHEATGLVVNIDLLTGDKYRGTLKLVEDNMNCWLSNVIHTQPNGEKVQFDTAYIRGSNILFFDIPEMLVNSNLFNTGKNENKRSQHKKKIRRSFMTVKVRKQSH